MQYEATTLSFCSIWLNLSTENSPYTLGYQETPITMSIPLAAIHTQAITLPTLLRLLRMLRCNFYIGPLSVFSISLMGLFIYIQHNEVFLYFCRYLFGPH